MSQKSNKHSKLRKKSFTISMREYRVLNSSCFKDPHTDHYGWLPSNCYLKLSIRNGKLPFKTDNCNRGFVIVCLWGKGESPFNDLFPMEQNNKMIIYG